MPDHAPQARTPPFSLRLAPEERAQLIEAAGGEPLGSYIRSLILKAPKRRGFCPANRQALAQVLGLLGQSRIASNLNQLAKAAHMGVLVLEEVDRTLLREALADLATIRRLLIDAIGLKEDRP